MKDEWIRVFIVKFDRIDAGFSMFACGERPFGRRLRYPYDPVDQVQLLFKEENPFLIYIRFNSITLINPINT